MVADRELAVRGFVIGLSVAAPVGSTSLLCIRRTLSGGRAAGLASGLGVALGDATYASVAAFGLTVISMFLIDHQSGIQLIGGFFLI